MPDCPLQSWGEISPVPQPLVNLRHNLHHDSLSTPIRRQRGICLVSHSPKLRRSSDPSKFKLQPTKDSGVLESLDISHRASCTAFEIWNAFSSASSNPILRG